MYLSAMSSHLACMSCPCMDVYAMFLDRIRSSWEAEVRILGTGVEGNVEDNGWKWNQYKATLETMKTYLSMLRPICIHWIVVHAWIPVHVQPVVVIINEVIWAIVSSACRVHDVNDAEEKRQLWLYRLSKDQTRCSDILLSNHYLP